LLTSELELLEKREQHKLFSLGFISFAVFQNKCLLNNLYETISERGSNIFSQST